MLAPPARLTFRPPLATVSVTLSGPPSTSLTEIPAMASGVSSAPACAPGTVVTGTSLIAMVTVPAPLVELPAASVTVAVTG